MKFSRRTILKLMGIVSAFNPMKLFSKNTSTVSIEDLSHFEENDFGNEDFWNLINQSFTVSKNIINLNNGGVSPQPKIVQETFERYNRLSNEGPAYFMWRILDQGREPIRARLAELAGCTPEEIAINRNTTEGMDTIIFGLNLKPGDEVVLTKQDYPNVINAWKLREIRDNIKLIWVDLNLPSNDKNYLVNSFVSAFTSRTKVVNITQMINWNGQILPVKEIADEAKKLGILVLVDAAHAFAHFEFKFPELNCDFLATSLHKWLCAPFGTGLLYIRKELIKDIPPLFPNDKPYSDNIRKFESLGTRSFPAEMAIGEAINFHSVVGPARKESRLRWLKKYWTNELSKIPKIKILTPDEPDFSCGLGLFAVEGVKPEDVSNWLFEKKKIFTVAINWENIHGIRVTPHIYTRPADLDVFCDSINEFVKNH